MKKKRNRDETIFETLDPEKAEIYKCVKCGLYVINKQNPDKSCISCKGKGRRLEQDEIDARLKKLRSRRKKS